MEISDICEQKRVDRIFIPLKEKYPKIKEKIEQIEFLFKNSCYNKNQMILEVRRLNKGFEFPNKQLNFEIKIPLTIWSDIIGFEFQSCLYNIIRAINYTIIFNLNQIENLTLKDYPSIGKYQREVYSSHKLYSFFKKNYNSWIKELNNIRNEFTHKILIKKFGGWLEMKQKVSKKSVKNEGKITPFCEEYGCINFETFLEKKITLLEKYVKEFFKKFEEIKNKN